MINQSSEWVFVKKPSRPPLSDLDVEYWKHTLKRLLKAGIEIELNLPDKNGRCDRQNFLCECRAVFNAPEPMPGTSKCYEQCAKWDNGNCSIAKAEGCAGVHCFAFQSPCPSCSKFDRGCDTCPELYDIRKDPRYIRETIGKDLQPTRFVGEHGATGTYKVCRDGSLLGDGGVEVATVGRRVQFMPLYEMIRNIVDISKRHGAYTNERCSIHVHMLASYLTPSFGEGDKGDRYIASEITELERPVPEIIVANFHQLVRRYQCALIWMTAAGEKRNKLTRWEKFRKSILPYSAVRHKMPVVVKEVGSASKSKRKYALMNYELMRFNEIGEAERLHVEGRYMDGCLSAAAITAHACLLFGLMVKAVEISRHGVLQSGNHQYMKLQREIYARLCNNDGPWDADRHSDTSNLDPYIPELQKQSRQLIRLVKNTLSELSPADEILRALAERPIAMRRIDGQSWEDIERDLMPEVEYRSDLEESLLRIVSLGAISECETASEWVEAATVQIANERDVGHDEAQTEELRQSIREYVFRLNDQQRISWSDSVGSFLAG